MEYGLQFGDDSLREAPPVYSGIFVKDANELGYAL